MENKEIKPTLKEPSADYGGKYSYADYLNWGIEEMVEIIEGKVFR